MKRFPEGIENVINGDIFAYAAGRQFERWIDSVGGATRDEGHSVNGIILTPSGIIESILRDEVFVERDLRVSTVTSTTLIIVSGLKSSVDDYYNNAIYYNVTTGHKTYVSDYTGSTKTLTLAAADTSATAADNIYLTNIQGDNKINYQSFDVIGNTTSGTRKDWLFGRSINSFSTPQALIEQLCFESHSILLDTYDGYKFLSLDEAASADTWTVPLTRNSERELVSGRLSPLSDIYTDFRLKYAFDYASGTYKKEFFVNRDVVSSNASILGATEKTKCANAETDYKVKKYFEYSSDWIYDDNTAEYLLQKLVNWLTKQYAIVTWAGEFNSHIKYEIGDQVILNYANMVPTGINNSSKFIIFSKEINPLTPSVTFQLLEVGAGISVLGYGSRYGSSYGRGY